MQWKCALFWLSLTVQLYVNECLDCYSCSNVSHVAQCQSVLQCPSGYLCHATVNSDTTYTLGCKDSQLCSIVNTTSIHPGGTGSIVGRSVSGGCSECCETGMCNRQLCQSHDPTCHNSGHVDCVHTGSFVNLCSETEHAKKECRRFCGLCSMVDGGWSDWSIWASCSVSCGNGTMSRTRSCSNPTPANGGSDCTGVNHNVRACSNIICPVNGGWGSWSAWGSCSVSCGIGLQRRDRTCSSPFPSNSGVHCFGDARDDKICLSRACEDGNWTDWSQWSVCSRTCDMGTHKRSRSCTNPTPSVLGRSCVGDNIQVETCSVKPCVDQAIGFTVNGPKDTGTSGHITFTHVVTNKGGGYNTTSGEFTCSVAGAYSFSLTILLTEGSAYAACSIYKNSAFLGKAHVDPRDAVNVGYIPASTTVFVHLLPADKVYLSHCTSASSMMSAYEYSSFTGYLIHMD